jgi:hypothetical protein
MQNKISGNNFSFLGQYKKPIKLTRALINHSREEKSKGNDEYVKRIESYLENVYQNETLANYRVSKYIATGSSAIVFETEDGNVLKLTKGNHFPLNREVQDFDVPIYKKGKAGKVYYYVEEKLSQHSMPDYFVEIMKDRIKNAGFKSDDLLSYDTFQLGLSKEGELYLLDPECAKYKTTFHAIYAKLKSRFGKK